MRLIYIVSTLVVCISAASLKDPSTLSDAKEKIRYDNYKVYKLNIKNKLQLSVIELMQNMQDKYNIWKEYDESTKEVHIMVKPEEDKNFEDLLKVYHLEAELMISNVQELIDEEQKAPDFSPDMLKFGWTSYYTLAAIEQWLDDILATYPTVTEGLVIGQSYEGRNIRGIKISYKTGNPGIFIESNIHSREWITSATATWFINQLLTSNDAKVRNLAENYDWYIIPVLNVDGYVYTHTTDRMWRKTRQPVSNSSCIGTDANRNFDFHWMENGGASNDPCSETFAGPQPFSSPEAKALADYVTSIKDDLNIYLAFHSYGQYFLSPYGHSKTVFPTNYNDLLSIGKSFTTAIWKLLYKTHYQYGSTANVLYIASGTSVDWAYGTNGIEVGFTIEFRDRGLFGFVLPPQLIIPNCQELMAGMLALVDKSKQLGYV